jgi:tetratricopeptide (TPR) repeat protein
MIDNVRSLFLKQNQRKLPFLIAVLAAVTIAYGIRSSAGVTRTDSVDDALGAGGRADASSSYPEKVFASCENAVKLADHDAVNYENLATAVFTFRTDAQKYFALKNEQAVFDRSIELYRHALDLDPANFNLAVELADSYFMIKPLRSDDGIAAWNTALKIAATPEQRDEAHLNLARFHLKAGRLDLVRSDLDQMPAGANLQSRQSIIRSLVARETAAKHHVSIEGEATGGR